MPRTDLTAREAAALVGVKPASFRSWAQRRDLEPSRQVRLGRATVNLFDADEVLDAQRVTPKPWRPNQ